MKNISIPNRIKVKQPLFLGEYGRLGHGDNVTQLRPKQIKSLMGQRVVQVACGSRDAQTLALTDDGKGKYTCPRYRDSPVNGDPTSVLVIGTPRYRDKNSW
jgi:hypothetical protein